jgi:hypothetical protein
MQKAVDELQGLKLTQQRELHAIAFPNICLFFGILSYKQQK